MPAILPYSREDTWPSIVVEVKWTEGRPIIEQDMRFWLEGPGGQVEVALTISAYPHGSITIEKWTRDHNRRLVILQTMTVVR